MTRDEVKQILMRLQNTYPNWKIENKTLTIETWFEYLEAYTYQEILGAVKSFVLSDTKGFAPTVGQLVAQLHQMAKAIEPDIGALEAWAMVSKAIRNGYYGAEDEFAKLPPLVQKAVGSPMNIRNWSQTDMKSIETVVMSQFLSAYKAECTRENQLTMIPDSVKLEMKERMMLRDSLQDEDW